MRLAMLDLMQGLYEAVFRLEGMADELVATSNSIEGQPVADVMRGLARHHRVKALELRAHCAVLKADYAERFGADGLS